MKPERIRARALAEWRGLPEIPFPVHRAIPASETVAKVMQALGLQDRLKAETVISAWREMVGDFVARHSSPRQLKDGVLHVSVLQPTVCFELERVWKREILEKLKARFGPRTVRDIRFRIG